MPAMPESSGKLLDLLAVPPEARDFASLGDNGRLGHGIKLPEPTPIFPRYAETDDDAGKRT
jgi:methionyl-tRNA synthetase